MSAFFAGLNTIEKIFLVCAVIGGFLFLIRTILFFLGGDTDTDADFDIDADIDVDVDVDGIEVDTIADGTEIDASAVDSAASFHIFSLHGITGFFMMFGIVGLAMSYQSKLSAPLSVGGALLAGVFTMWLVAKILIGMKRLQSDGTIHLSNAVGNEGTVYLSIPAEGTGKIQVIIQDRLMIFDAKSGKKEEIKTGENVRVSHVTKDGICIVEKL